MFDEWMAELDVSRGPIPLPFTDEYFDRVMAARDLLDRRFTIPYRAALAAGDTTEVEFLEALESTVHRHCREGSRNG